MARAAVCGRCTSVAFAACIRCGTECCTEHGRALAAAVIDRRIGAPGKELVYQEVVSDRAVCAQCDPDFACFECGNVASRLCGCGRAACEKHSALTWTRRVNQYGVFLRDDGELVCTACIRESADADLHRREIKRLSGALVEVAAEFLRKMEAAGCPGAQAFFEVVPLADMRRRERKRFSRAVQNDRRRAISAAGNMVIKGESVEEALRAFNERDARRSGHAGARYGWFVGDVTISQSVGGSARHSPTTVQIIRSLALITGGMFATIEHPDWPRPEFSPYDITKLSGDVDATRAEIARRLHEIASKHSVALSSG